MLTMPLGTEVTYRQSDAIASSWLFSCLAYSLATLGVSGR